MQSKQTAAVIPLQQSSGFLGVLASFCSPDGHRILLKQEVDQRTKRIPQGVPGNSAVNIGLPANFKSESPHLATSNA
jgi:hypothetical protein